MAGWEIFFIVVINDGLTIGKYIHNIFADGPFGFLIVDSIATIFVPSVFEAIFTRPVFFTIFELSYINVISHYYI